MIADFLTRNCLYFIATLAFIAIVVWVYRPSARRRYEADGNIPFDQDDDTRPARAERL